MTITLREHEKEEWGIKSKECLARIDKTCNISKQECLFQLCFWVRWNTTEEIRKYLFE